MDYLIHLAILFSIYAMLGITLNVLVGYTGLLSVSHASFFGIGAYGTALLMVDAHWNFFPALMLASIVGGMIAYMIGCVLSRFRDDYYALGSLGLNVIIFSFFLNLQTITRGPLGIPGIVRPNIGSFHFSENSMFLALVLCALALLWMFFHHVTRSSFGMVLRAIREDEDAIQVFGYRTHFFKLAIFVLSAMGASIAGAFFASYISYIDPFSFTVNESVFLLALIILGGLASHTGSVLGALIFVLLPEALRFVGFPQEYAAQMRQLVYGVLLIILVLYRPRGIAGTYTF
ncbi:branched-chain amino acid ABC transporter permease [Candidatus Uhrbacteria bacterium]|nr:branched-chain amino acid ABC transporter permease [Candidatus Uhrbacteria bacterium]